LKVLSFQTCEKSPVATAIFLGGLVRKERNDLCVYENTSVGRFLNEGNSYYPLDSMNHFFCYFKYR